jgi:mannose-6-phosphate isomerase-like protein (cupin superfamily)
MSEGDPTAVRNVTELAGGNEWFRQTIVTGEHAQLVVMTIQPGEEIGEETHEGDQILQFVAGRPVAAHLRSRTAAIRRKSSSPRGARPDFRREMEPAGLEPATSTLPAWRSPS